MSSDKKSDSKLNVATKTAGTLKENSNENIYGKDTNISNVKETSEITKHYQLLKMSAEPFGSSNIDVVKPASKLSNIDINQISKEFQSMQQDRPAVKVLGLGSSDPSATVRHQYYNQTYDYTTTEQHYPSQTSYLQQPSQTQYMYQLQSGYSQWGREEPYQSNMWGYSQSAYPQYYGRTTDQLNPYGLTQAAHPDWGLNYSSYKSGYYGANYSHAMQNQASLYPYSEQQLTRAVPEPVAHLESETLKPSSTPAVGQLLSFSKKPPKSILRNWSVPGYDGIPTTPLGAVSSTGISMDSYAKKKASLFSTQDLRRDPSNPSGTGKFGTRATNAGQHDNKLDSEVDSMLRAATLNSQKPTTHNLKKLSEFSFGASDFQRERVVTIPADPEESSSKGAHNKSIKEGITNTTPVSKDPRLKNNKLQKGGSNLKSRGTHKDHKHKKSSRPRELNPRHDDTSSGRSSQRSDSPENDRHFQKLKSVSKFLEDRKALDRGSLEKSKFNSRFKVKWQRNIKLMKYFWYEDEPVRQAHSTEELLELREQVDLDLEQPNCVKVPKIQIGWEFPARLKFANTKPFGRRTTIEALKISKRISFNSKRFVLETDNMDCPKICEPKQPLGDEPEVTVEKKKIAKRSISPIISEISQSQQAVLEESSLQIPESKTETQESTESGTDSGQDRPTLISCMKGTRAALTKDNHQYGEADYVRELDDRYSLLQNPMLATIDNFLQMMGLVLDTKFLRSVRDKIENASIDLHYKQIQFPTNGASNLGMEKKQQQEFSLEVLDWNLKLVKAMLECNARVQVHSSNIFIPLDPKLTNDMTSRLRQPRMGINEPNISELETIIYPSSTSETDTNAASSKNWVGQRKVVAGTISSAEFKLASLGNPEKYRKRPCNLYHSEQGCTRGHHCLFIHDGRFIGQLPPDNTILNVRLEDYGPEPPEGYVAFYEKKALRLGFTRTPGRRSDGGDGRGVGCSTIEGEQPIYYRSIENRWNAKGFPQRPEGNFKLRVSDGEGFYLTTGFNSEKDKPDASSSTGRTLNVARSKSSWNDIDQIISSQQEESATMLGKRSIYHEDRQASNSFQQGGHANTHTSRWANFHQNHYQENQNNASYRYW